MPCSEHKDSGLSLRTWEGWRRVLFSRVCLYIIKYIEEATFFFTYGTTLNTLMGKDSSRQRFLTVYSFCHFYLYNIAYH